MQKLRLLLIGIGFFWIFAWSLFGSILGVYMNNLIATGVEKNWNSQWQFSVLKAAHSHMNLMGITLILLGLSMHYLKPYVSDKIVKSVVLANVASIPIFGIGLTCEAFLPPSNGSVSWVTGVTALGGIIYMLTIAIWAVFFISGIFWKNKP